MSKQYDPNALLTSDRDRMLWARWMVKKILTPYGLEGCLQRLGDFEDACQIVEQAVFTAGERFDPSRANFGTFVFYVARSELMRAVEKGGLIYRPFGLPKTKTNLEHHKATAVIDSLNGIRLSNGRGWLNSLEDLVVDAHEDGKEEDTTALMQAYQELKESERELLRLRYWEGLTLEQIGKRYGVCKERIRQRQKTILKKLRGSLAEEYMDQRVGGKAKAKK